METEHEPRGEEGIVATEGLVDGLLEIASNREPSKVTVDLSVTEGSAFASAAVAPDTPVFSHYYVPGVARSASNVFGMNLTVPPGQTQGRFVSHPRQKAELTTRDTLHAVVFLAVPPWTREDIRVFDRSGRRQHLELIDEEPPPETLP